jgi:2-haloacid dehalogenase
MTGKRAVLFDLGNVLIEWDPRLVYRTLFQDPAEMEHFLADVCGADWNRAIDGGKPLMQSVRERQALWPQYAEMIGLWATRWRDMLPGAMPDSVAILKELKDQGTPIYALTNWSRETFPPTRERFAFLGWFKDIVVSGFEGLAKPDPALYRLTMERCGLVPAETVFVDDLQLNIDAALTVGLDAVRFTGAPALRQALVERGILTPR